MNQDRELRNQLITMLRGGHAHATFDQTVNDFPVKLAGTRPDRLPHSGWELLEHIRITQNDILRFSRSADYQEMKWPDEYWPKSAAPASESDWAASVKAVHEDMEAFISLLNDPSRDLFTPFPWGNGQTLLREAILIVDHSSYHLGQMILIRRALGAWNG